jgi:hypothetical protein
MGLCNFKLREPIVHIEYSQLQLVMCHVSECPFLVDCVSRHKTPYSLCSHYVSMMQRPAMTCTEHHKQDAVHGHETTCTRLICPVQDLSGKTVRDIYERVSCYNTNPSTCVLRYIEGCDNWQTLILYHRSRH